MHIYNEYTVDEEETKRSSDMTMMNTTKPGVGGLTLSSITVDRGIEHIMDVEKIVVRKHKPH